MLIEKIDIGQQIKQVALSLGLNRKLSNFCILNFGNQYRVDVFLLATFLKRVNKVKVRI